MLSRARVPDNLEHVLQPAGQAARLFDLSYGSPFAQAFIEPHLWRETHRLSDSSHLLVAGVIDPALPEVGDVGACHDAARRLIYLLSAPPAPVGTTVHL